MVKNGVRIISVEARDVYASIKKYGEETGYRLPEKNSFAYLCLFKNILEYSLDSIELEKAYTSICRRKFCFTDKNGKACTLAVVNLKFSRAYYDVCGTSESKVKDLRQLREYFYVNGFNLGGVHYVRYKRSSGSSRQGKCLFIDERLHDHMAKWGECGLTAGEKDLASWESYKALSLSAVKSIVNIPLDGILYIRDYKSVFEEEVVSIEEINGVIASGTRLSTVKNDIWDGESLLDESVFVGEYGDRHMLLLRNKFFKSCAFKTKLQKWFKDKGVTLEALKARGCVTLAADIAQIVMVTTPNSMKYLKFMDGGLTENNVRRWTAEADSGFGVVKYDKRTKFFDGDMVQTSYQFINSLALNGEQAERLLADSKGYISLIRDDYDFMRYHFRHAYKREEDGTDGEIADGLAERSDVIFRLMNINYAFKDTRLYANFCNDVVENQKLRLKEGHVLLSGTNATLFGNGPEMLLALSGEFDVDNPDNSPVALGRGEIACARFADGKKLVCARSPHITMGNLYYATNNLRSGLWQYFDLGKNVVCVNAIGENIQQRLNGCDYDSDSMLITDDELVVDTVARQKDAFAVPVCNIAFGSRDGQSLAEMDHATSVNSIGDIVNQSQIMNSVLWDKINSGEITRTEADSIYRDICILAVLSGIEIDKAKRAYDKICMGSVLYDLREKYGKTRPQFFKHFDDKEVEKRLRRIGDGQLREIRREELTGAKEYKFFNTSMEYVFRSSCEIDFRKGKAKRRRYIPVIQTIREPQKPTSSTVYAQKDRIIALCEEYKKQIGKLYRELECADEDEKEVVYEKIFDKKTERNENINRLLTDEYVLYLVLKHYDKSKGENWHIYAPVLQSELFVSMLLKSREGLSEIVKDDDGDYSLYGKNYTKI
ncbi:MAG: hypothetical protein ACI4MH_07005 [Candidatus Coproplasma sp.]